jgi:hypothetical protein
VGDGREEVARSKHFVTELVRLEAGEVWLLPDEGEQAAIMADGPSRFLRTWVPC